MDDQPVPMTAAGRADIEAEYEHLVTVRRAEIAAQIGAAADDGDLSENAAYDHAKEEQARVEGRIAALARLRRHAVLIERPSGGVVQLGSTVTVEQDGARDTYTILGRLESAPAQGRISNESPLGRALLSHRAGDRVEVRTPSGPRTVLILAVH